MDNGQGFFDRPLTEVDPEAVEVVGYGQRRQHTPLEMMAAEGFMHRAVMQKQTSIPTTECSQGAQNRHRYHRCEPVDLIEQLATDRATVLFGAEFANVQPHSGEQSNTAAIRALLDPGETILGLDLAHGGYLAQGMWTNSAGLPYTDVAYHVREADCLVDMDEVEQLAKKHRPKLITAGWSAYPRQLDFARFRRIADEVGAYLMVDMAHFADLVAAGLYPSPMPHAHVVTTTTHQTLGGPRGGVILTNDPAIAERINSAVLPGDESSPLEYVIAAKAVAFAMATSQEFIDRQRRALAGAQAIAGRLLADDTAEAGVRVLTGGTDVHLVLVDLRGSELNGKQAQDRLHSIGIMVNRHALPFDPRPHTVTSGLRISRPSLATRGLGIEDFSEVADVISHALQPNPDTDALRGRVTALAKEHTDDPPRHQPLPEQDYGHVLHKAAPPQDIWPDRARSQSTSRQESRTARRSETSLHGLTEREWDIAHLVGRGHTNKEIATALFISVKTVEYHLGNIYARCQLTNRRQLRDHVQQYDQMSSFPSAS
ncbi:serine hydroxymethyltransferase [Streptomyces sp. TRM72054]|nr:serine hydroxymethyltransferase [Streptomyces sp. TRM72054]